MNVTARMLKSCAYRNSLLIKNRIFAGVEGFAFYTPEDIKS